METTPPRWPPYLTGPDGSLFAVGVASAKFAELEPVLWLMFSAVFDLEKEKARMICAKIGAEASQNLVLQQLQNTPWTTEAKELVEYFIKGFGICLSNRNHLVHSELPPSESPVMFKTSKQGKTTVSLPTITELRGVADDINRYISFGKDLANSILNAAEASRPYYYDGARHPLPGKPPLPRAMNYSPVHPGT